MPDQKGKFVSTEKATLCPNCGHHYLIHSREGCEIGQTQSGYPGFASLPKCGCKWWRESNGNWVEVKRERKD